MKSGVFDFVMLLLESCFLPNENRAVLSLPHSSMLVANSCSFASFSTTVLHTLKLVFETFSVDERFGNDICEGDSER